MKQVIIEFYKELYSLSFLRIIQILQCYQIHVKEFSLRQPLDQQIFYIIVFSKFIPQFFYNFSITKEMCKIVNCRYKHDKHVCVICGDRDSNHYASTCLQGMEIYHGTSSDAANIIKKEYFKPTLKGSLGQGVYFASNFHDALSIALYKFKLRWAVIKVKAKVEPDEEMESDPQKLLNFYQKVAASRYHQPWALLPSFREIVIRDPNRIRILKVFKRKTEVFLYDDRILCEYEWHVSIGKHWAKKNREQAEAGCKNVKQLHQQLIKLRQSTVFNQALLLANREKIKQFFEAMSEFGRQIQISGVLSDVI